MSTAEPNTYFDPKVCRFLDAIHQLRFELSVTCDSVWVGESTAPSNTYIGPEMPRFLDAGHP